MLKRASLASGSLPHERGCWNPWTAFPGVPSFLASKVPHPFLKTKDQQGHRHTLLRRQFGAVTLRRPRRSESLDGVSGGVPPNTCSQFGWFHFLAV